MQNETNIIDIIITKLNNTNIHSNTQVKIELGYRTK